MNQILLITVLMSSLALPGCLMTRDQIREGTARSSSPSSVSQEQIKKAETAARVDDLEAMIRANTGKMEVLENEINQMKRLEIEKQASGAPGEDTQKRFAIFEEALKAMERQIQTLAAEVQSLKSSSASSGGGKKRKKGNFAGAQEAFGKKDWKRAIVGYQKYRDLNPKGKWYPEATYKIGVSFQELKMTSEAKAFFEEVIAKYPKDKHSKKAKYRLKNLK